MVILAHLAEVGGNVLHLRVKLEVSHISFNLLIHIASDLPDESVGIVLLLLLKDSRALSYEFALSLSIV